MNYEQYQKHHEVLEQLSKEYKNNVVFRAEVDQDDKVIVNELDVYRHKQSRQAIDRLSDITQNSDETLYLAMVQNINSLLDDEKCAEIAAAGSGIRWQDRPN